VATVIWRRAASLLRDAHVAGDACYVNCIDYVDCHLRLVAIADRFQISDLVVGGLGVGVEPPNCFLNPLSFFY